MASQMLKEVVHDTTPLSRFVVPTVFIVFLRCLPFAPFHLLQSTPQSFLPLLQQLYELQLISLSPLLLVLHFSTIDGDKKVKSLYPFIETRAIDTN